LFGFAYFFTSFVATRTPTGSNIRFGAGVEFQTVEADSTRADRDLGQTRSYVDVEDLARHCKLRTGVSRADDSRKDLDRQGQ
jgi:hypothetical protein